MQRQVLYLGEINASQREAWRKTIELQDAGTRRQVALFPAGSMPVEDVDAIGVRLSELSLRRPRQRGDCRQVVIALIVTPEGFPLSCEVMGGGTADSTTLSAFLDRIGDEGMTIARSDFAREDLKGITTGRRLDPCTLVRC